MEDGKIPHSALKAYSWNANQEPYRARLNSRGKVWGTSHFYRQPFLQIYVGRQTKLISAIATEGGYHGWVEAYTVSFSPNGGDWLEYIEDGKIKVTMFII
jgi:hypothetical protein